MTNQERNAEMETRRQGLKTLDRKNLLANFVAYWPGQATKGASQYDLMNAILQAEFEPQAALRPTGTKATQTWG
jgi:hypothetical protein